MKLEGVRQVRVLAAGGGFRVLADWRPAADEMWEVLYHEALFVAVHDARRLAERVAVKGEIDLDHWVWHPSKGAPVAFLQEAPKARLEVVPRPASEAARAAAWNTID
jgi:DNA-directed RNA polymerase alpha subunit